jgi:hypothetical protein
MRLAGQYILTTQFRPQAARTAMLLRQAAADAHHGARLRGRYSRNARGIHNAHTSAVAVASAAGIILGATCVILLCTPVAASAHASGTLRRCQTR